MLWKSTVFGRRGIKVNAQFKLQSLFWRAKYGCPNCEKNMQAVTERAVSDKWLEKEAPS
jgi:hypothetical protein